MCRILQVMTKITNEWIRQATMQAAEYVQSPMPSAQCRSPEQQRSPATRLPALSAAHGLLPPERGRLKRTSPTVRWRCTLSR